MNNTKSLIKTLTQIAMAVLLVMAIPAAQAAKSGGGKISVTAASPGEALQGEELDVIVSGSGFDAGTTAIYLVTGTNDDTQIEVISTEYVDANQLRTRIRVKGAATIIDYDIQATNSRGRRGKGTTLFSVKQSSGGSNGGGGNPNLGDDYTATDGVTFISPSDVGSFDYHIIGTPAPDEIYAGGGKDLIEGGSEGDHIWARGGDDEILGGGGHIYGGTGDDIIIVGDDSHNLWGDEGDDILIGGDGGGGISGGEGTDWLEGGDSGDWIEFSLGSLISLPDQYDVDHYDGKLGEDHLIFWDEEETVESVFVDMVLGIYEANARDSFGTLVTVSGEFFNFENIEGTVGDDLLLGDDASNKLTSRNGDNIIYGFGGNDQIGTNGEGNNIVYGGSGNDRLAAVGDGNNIVFGEAGDDFFGTGLGDNELHGGEGCDVYSIDWESGGTTIMDFEPACEKIYIGPPNRHLSIEIYDVGNDTIIEFVVRKRTVGTIMLKDTVLNGVTVNESIFIYEQFPDFDCSRYYCDPFKH